MPAKQPDEPVDATVGAASIAPMPEINPRVPPRFVRHKRTGMTMNWSSLFNRRCDEFEPFYRAGTSDQADHIAAMQHWNVMQMMMSGMLGGGMMSPAQLAMMQAGAQNVMPGNFPGFPGGVTIDGDVVGSDR